MKCFFTRFVVLAVLAMPALLPAQVTSPRKAKPGGELMEIVLEKKTGVTGQVVDAGHVFQTGDSIRFRLRPAFDGYLYVTDLGTTGRSNLLFPRQETGADNRIEHGKEYVVPATPDGWFEVSGPPGYETLYFVMSPVPLGATPSVNPNQGIPQGTAPPTMHPRCNDEIFKARGECVDGMAGPQRVDPKTTLPPTVRELFGDTPPGPAARDLNFAKKDSTSVVTSASPMNGPVVYQFLLAHN